MAKEEGKIVQVRVQDIDHNPFRKLSIYAIQRDKVDRLKESIHATGFWETVIGRYNPDPQKAGRVQIAFGHHRITAALEVFKPDDTIPIIIRDLSDDQMREMMIRENAEEYHCVPAAIDDAVIAARDYLEGHREELQRLLTASGHPEAKRPRVGAPAIAASTGYSENAVELSLQRRKMIDSGEVDQEAIYRMPHQEAARRFWTAMLKAKLPVDDQKRVAEKLVKDGRFGELSIEQTVREFQPLMKVTDKHHAGYHQALLMKATRKINEAASALDSFSEWFNEPTVFGGVPTDEDISEEAKQAYNRALERFQGVAKWLGGQLDRNPEHGKAMFPPEELGEPYRDGSQNTSPESPDRCSPVPPTTEKLEAIREKIAKAKARLQETKETS